MNLTHLLDPINATVQWGATWGATLYIAVRREFGWSVVLTVFLVAEVMAFYVTIPLAMWLGWSMERYGFVAFGIGLSGLLFLGAILNTLQRLHDDPQGTVSYWWRLFRGAGAGRGPDGGGTP